MTNFSTGLRARAVIFDMDGLLVDSEPLWQVVIGEVFSAIGVDVTGYLAHGATMGLRVDEVIDFFRSHLGFDEPTEALASAIIGGVVEAVATRAVLLPGAREAIEFCESAGLDLALASGSMPAVIEAVLSRFQLEKHFGVVCSAADDRLGKPHPAVFLRAAAELGVDPGVCVVLEDSLNGCIAAKAAKMRVIAVPAPQAAHDVRFAIADAVLASLEELPGARAAEVLGLG